MCFWALRFASGWVSECEHGSATLLLFYVVYVERGELDVGLQIEGFASGVAWNVALCG
jgi:hypothetical protein